ncbi:ABC amino acid transporter, inner membrane subunit [Caballeronia choica]|jgi:polar amino acid transport system permease protein|uniref:ABC amino acid transporter, inner membrane subunit n=1 Tax=Caballeronia choica TaxID=326476 RepID=A0A158L026_9BURK|nr:amino acid ABC transporter permease [Caballeronia choica]SAL86200.1 ABC amino acid transporter, inner membrane subunit [Caballeronia choica]
MSYQWLSLWGYVPEFLKAGLLTLEVTFLAFVLAVFLALVTALASMSPLAVVRFIARAYVEVIRNTPVLLQIFIVFFGLPSAGISLDAYWAGVIALGLNVGAYLSEVFRAGIQSVPRGQLEAAGILGLERGQIFTEIVLPQAARAVYPAIVNYLIQLLLGTSLLSAIALPELTGTATVINSRTLLYIQTFTVVLVAYLVLSNVLSWLASQLGARMFHPPLIVRPRARFGRFALRRANRA